MKTKELSRTVNTWDIIPKPHQAILFIGLTNSGRTTLAELIKKYQMGINNPAFTFDGKQYSLEGVITPKPTKIQTTTPRYYPSTNPNQPDIIDVPCYCLTPDKKWSPFEQKVTVNLMMQHVNRVGFVFFINQKNTRTNIISWKKTFYGFLELFKEFPDDLIDSMGWIVTSCSPQLNEQSIAKRLRNLQKNLKDEKHADPALIDRIFDSIIDNNHYYIGRKGEKETEEKDTINLYKQLIKLPGYDANKDHIAQKINFNNEDLIQISEYIEEIDQSFCQVIKALKQIMVGLPRVDKEEVKQSIYSGGQSEEIVSQEVIDSLRQKDQSYQLWQVIKAFKQTKQALQKQENEGNNLLQVIQKVATFPFFNKGTKDQQMFQKIFEAIRFSILTKSEFNAKRTLNILREIFIKQKQLFYEYISEAVEDNDNLEFYENSLELLEEQTNISEKTKQFLNKCKQSVNNFRSPKKLLQKLIQVLENNKDSNKQIETSYKIAMTMEKVGKIKEASEVFKAVKSPGDFLRCFQQIEVENQTSALSYVSYLAETYLFETAKKACYDFSARFGYSSRQAFGQQLKKVIKDEQTYNKSKGQNMLLQQVRLSPDEIKKILQECKTVCANIKDD